jgi:hypothetical protein
LALVPGTHLGDYEILALVGAGNPATLFETRCFSVPTSPTSDVSPDDQRFLMVKKNAGGDQNAMPASPVVVEHWFGELKARLPTK